MRNALIAVAALALAGVAAVPRPPSAAEPPAGFTGGFGEPTCLHCHIGNEVNAFGGSIHLEGLPATYVPGEAYVVTVRLQADETAVAGFQLTARVSTGPAAGANAGSLTPVDARTTTKDSVGITYAHQSPAGTVPPDPSGSSWAVTWTAPRDPVPVALHVTGNSGNADESPLGDLVYTQEVVLEPGR